MSGRGGGAIRVVRAGVERAGELAAQVAAASWTASAERLKVSGSGEVLAGEAAFGGARRPVIVKRLPLDRPKDRVARLAGRTRLARQWRGAMLLRAAGIPTAAPLVLFRRRDDAGGIVETLVLERLPGPTLLERASRDADGARGLAYATGELTARLTLAAPALFNRDHKPSNIVVVEGADGRPAPHVIDTTGVRRWRVTDRPAAMLAKLLIEALGVGASVSRTQRWRVLRGYYAAVLEDWSAAPPPARRTSLKRAWRAIERMAAGHGDPTPKDDPLGGRGAG